jgi:meromycolic acid enoyl-[acyl-carrier-protein] reductase
MKRNGLLEGKRLLITGVLTERSLAFGVAAQAQEEGAEVLLTGAGRGLPITRRVAQRLPKPADVCELDVTVPEHFAALGDELGSRWGAVDGALHAIGFAPPSCLGGGFLDAPWDDVGLTLNVSAFSLKALVAELLPLFRVAGGGSVVGLDFDASRAWPAYDWMGVAKAGLEACARYLAREAGADQLRVNLVAAGPIETMAARSIPGVERFQDAWPRRAPLGWDAQDSSCVAKACVALFSDLFPMTTGEVIHVDGGFHAIGA